MEPSADFYDALPRETEFRDLTDASRYHALPDDWQVGVADVVASTKHVSEGRYKSVNMVGAAVISAVMNALHHRSFPFVFGGDGAGFAVKADDAPAARQAIAAVARWAETEFGIELRAGLVGAGALRSAGHPVRVTRFQVSQDVDYAMFGGGGLALAETWLKTGRIELLKAESGAVPDLTGLSCRWAHMPARQGSIVSLVAAARPEADPQAVSAVFRKVIALADTLESGGHPATRDRLRARWPTNGTTLEAHASRAGGSLLAAKARTLVATFLGWALLRTGVRLGGFEGERYASAVAANADFRKLDDGLKMTLDCDPATRARLESILRSAAQDGLLRYGIATQDEAMMTCIVPSAMADDHLHFVDGASGGYTNAAAAMKSV